VAAPVGAAEPPYTLEVEVTISGFSIKLWTKDSTGTDGVGGVTGTGPVTC
jgi:hypothetical protein